MGRERREGQAEHGVVAVGLTGSIGAGKSTALAMFGECGALVISADQLVHRLYQRPEVAALVGERFGRGVIGATGAVDRARLAKAIRNRPGELRWLEELTHPLVAEDIRRSIDGAPEGTVVVCEVPLLFESGFERLFDLVVTVEAGPEVRRRRSRHGFGLEQFAELEAMQAGSERRVEGSDLVFVNDGDLGRLRGFVRDAYEVAQRLSGSRALRGQAAPRGVRGYWIGPEGEPSVARDSAPRGARPAGARPAARHERSRARSGRRRVLLGMTLSLAVLVALAIVAVLVFTGETVMPGVSAKLFPLHYQDEIAVVAGEYGQDPYLVAAMVRTESGFDAQAQSQAGAVGLMQLMPDTAEWVAGKLGKWQAGSGPDLTNPVDNLELGTWYLAYLGDKYGDGSLAALAAYNAGLGHVDEWIEAAGGLASFTATDIQYPETRQYVERVEHYRELYRRVYPNAFAQSSR
jgi:soluble lytic murein transglycosylase